MTSINTVLGPMDTSEMGFTLCHEHIITTSSDVRTTFPNMIDQLSTVKLAVRDLSKAHSKGLDTIMDPTTHDQGRDVVALIEVSEKSNVNIIICTGTWLDIPRFFWDADPDLVADLYTSEIENGIEGTGVKAGFIKVASDVGGITPQEEIVLRAAARTQKRTGVPILTHTCASERIGDQQIEILKDEGADMNLISIGHSSDTTNLDYLTGLLNNGAWIGMDRNPKDVPGTANDQQRVETIKSLIDDGWAHRIMIGHDWDSNIIPHRTEMRKQREANNPDAYSYIIRRFIPELKNLGASQDDINKITINNPRGFFEGIS